MCRADGTQLVWVLRFNHRLKSVVIKLAEPMALFNVKTFKAV